MRSKEVDDAIDVLENVFIFKDTYDRFTKLDLNSIHIALNYISELEDMLSNRIAYTQLLEKDLFENCENYVVSKDKVKELKEKVHKTLDVNGITRAYQMFIDKDFEDLLGE